MGKESRILFPHVRFSRWGIKKDRFVYPRVEEPRDVTLGERIVGATHLIKSAAIEIFEQNHELVRELLKERSHSLPNLIHRSARLEIAELASNGLRLRMLDEEKEYGVNAARARENPLLKDHAHDHERHVKRFIRLLFLSTTDNLTEYPEMVDGLGLYPHHHDEHQLLASLWNVGHPDQKVKPKDLHGPYGAVMIGAKVKEYALERHISLERAQKSINVAKLLILVHADPKRARERLHALIEQRFSDYDLFTLIEKEQKKGYGKFPTEFGFHPAFEQLKKDELTKMKNDTTPWFTNVTDEYLSYLEATVSVALLADLLPMVYPATVAHIRKLKVDMQLTRPLFVPIEVNTFLDFVSQKEGNNAPDDFTRAMWEFASLADEFLSMGFEKNSYIYQKIMEVVIFGILETRTYFKHLMNGEEGPRFIEHSFVSRLHALGRKAIHWSYLRKEFQTKHTLKTLHEFVEKYKDKVPILYRKYYHMRSDMNLSISRLRLKPGNSEGRMKVYPHEDFVVLDHYTHEMLNSTGEKFGLTKKEITEMVHRWRQGARPHLPGAGSYDSLGNVSSAKTLVEPPPRRATIFQSVQDYRKTG